jgi:hypothetical protein
MQSPELVFLHIPKAAGTSQRGAFQKHYGADNIFWFGRDCPPDIRRYPQDQIGERFVVGGHKPLSFYPRHIDPLYCAILRHPIERVISLFGFYTRPELAITEGEKGVRTKVLHQKRSEGIDPDSMLLSIRNCGPFREEISNFQCRYLSLGASTFAGVRKSLKKIDHVIGTMSSHDSFHRELGALLGWPEVPPVMVNRSRDNYSAPFLQDEELLALISELNREDQKLVEWVQTEHQGLCMGLRDARERRRRLRNLPLLPTVHKARELTLDDARDLWPPRGPQKLKWPLGRMMVSEPHKLVYMPIPGAANPVVKPMMLALSPVPHQQQMLALGIDRVVEHFATGLVLDDLTQQKISSVAESRDYFRFAILYEPVTRLVDVFQLRFVQMREQLTQWPQLHKLLADAQGSTDPDRKLGISFRQFVHACVSNRYNHLLLAAQARFLPWPDSYDRFYRPDQLPVLANDLAGLRGISVDLPEVTVNSLPLQTVAEAAYADTPAGQLPEDAAQWREKLVDEALLEMIKDFYASDFALYNRTADNKLAEY